MRIATIASLTVACALFARVGQAQDDTTTEGSAELSASAQAEPTTTEPAAEAAPADEPAAEEEDGEDEEAMNSFGFGLKLGVGMILGQDVARVTTGGGTSITTKENDVGLALGIPLYFGDGHGFGTDLEVFHWRQKNDFDQTLAYTGLQTAFGARFQVADPVYMFIGLGPRIGVVHGDVDVGVHAGLRLPIQVTYYPIKMLGIVGEIGLGYGATARTAVNVGGGGAPSGSTEAATGFLLDMTVGFRFP